MGSEMCIRDSLLEIYSSSGSLTGNAEEVENPRPPPPRTGSPQAGHGVPPTGTVKHGKKFCEFHAEDRA